MPSRRRVAQRIVVLPFAPVHAFELGVACEVYGMDRTDVGVPAFDFKVASAEGARLPTDHGFTIETPYGLEVLDEADLIVLPIWPRDNRERPPAEVLDALVAAYERGATLASFCSGAFVLAATGLLDGRRAATHWRYAEDLARLYPAIDVDASVLYLGEDRLFTSAGTASAIDLCLHLVRCDHGAEVANTIARRMVVPPHRDGGQSQYAQTPVPTGECPDDLARTLDWAMEHLDEPLTIAALAERANMSARTFARRFRDTVGATPLQWLLSQRVVLAQRLLETTELPMDVIAARCGLGSAANLRLHMGRKIGVPPSGYRQTFRQAG
jgi:transcriptional regulator GlxA family with amidase domain